MKINLNWKKPKTLAATGTIALLTSTSAMAVATPTVPEPSVLTLFAGGAAAFVIARIIKRRK